MSVESGQVPEGVIENLASMETVAPAAPPTVGEMLRGERERQGLAISDVANRLKYAPRQIEAIEADNFNALPGLTFVRGFARGYARLLGIDPAGLIAALERAANQDGGPTTVQLQSISASRAPLPEASTSHSSAWPWVFAIILVVAIVGGYSVYHWQAPASVVRKLDTGTTTPPAGTILPVSPVAIADGAAPATSSGVATGQTPSEGPGAGGPGTRATPAGGVAGTPVAATTTKARSNWYSRVNHGPKSARPAVVWCFREIMAPTRSKRWKANRRLSLWSATPVKSGFSIATQRSTLCPISRFRSRVLS